MSLLLLLSPNDAPVQLSRRAAYRPRSTRRCVWPPASGLALDNSSPAAVRSFNATTDTAPFSPPAGLLLAFAIGDANNGSLDEQLTITSTGGLIWSLVARGNGSNGGASTVEIWKARASTPPGSIVVTATDNKGAVAKSLFVQVVIDLSGRGVPDTGAVAFAAGNATYISTAPGSWGWAVGLGASNASTTAGASQVVADSVSGGGFDSGDNIWTIYQQYLTAVQGSSVTMSVTSPPVVVHNVAVEVVPFTTPLPPAPPRRSCRMPGLARRNRLIAPPWPTAQVVQPPTYIPGMPRRARLAAAQRRPRITLPPVAQSTPTAVPTPRRRLAQMLRRRPTLVTPADQLPAASRPRTRFLARTRRGQAVAVVPPQTVVTAPAYPPQPIRTRLRGMRLARGRSAQVVPDQITVINPPYPIQSVRTRLRGMRLTRGRSAQVVPGQVVVTAPAYPVQAWRARIRGVRLARGRSAQPVPSQEIVPTSGRVRQALQRFAALRRGHAVAPPVPQGLPPLLIRARARLIRAFRGRQRAPVPPQIVVVPPPYPPSGHRTRRVLVLAVRRRRSVAFLDAGHSCTTPRPSTGTTARPSSGTTAYNLTATARPSTGTTARPNTGTTQDPC